MKVAIQGVEGSFHHQAATQFFNQDIDIVGCENFVQVFEALEAGVVDRAVVAIENSLYGSINDTYDLLLKHKPTIIGEVYLHVGFNLFTNNDVALDAITDVYSQAPALAETKIWLRENIPQATLHEYPDTAMSARFVSNHDKKTVASIASKKAGELYDLHIAAEDIEDHQHNYTRFFILTKVPTTITEADKTTIIMRTNHKPGALYDALGAFANNDINLSKLESRPIVDHNSWRYIFYVDIEVSQIDDRAKKALTILEEHENEVTVLGSYKRGTLPNGIR